MAGAPAYLAFEYSKNPATARVATLQIFRPLRDLNGTAKRLPTGRVENAPHTCTSILGQCPSTPPVTCSGKLLSLALQIIFIFAIQADMNDQTDNPQAIRASDLAQDLRALLGKLKRRL